MMEQRRALTIPFSVDKDNLVSWTALAGCKHRHRDLHHKNGSMLFEPNCATMVTLETARRNPCLILTDVLKTERGKSYLERIKQSHTLGNGGKVPGTPRKSGWCGEEALNCRDARSSQSSGARMDGNKSETPKCKRRMTSSPSQRSRLRRRLQTVDDQVDKEENNDIEELIIGKDNREDYKFAEVVDCGLSVSWEPAEDTGGCDEFSPDIMKDRWTCPQKEVQHSVKSEKQDASCQCNGIGSPKRHRESVLRLSGEDGRDGGPACKRNCLEDSREDLDLESLDRTIVQFTVGSDDRIEVVVPIISANCEAENIASSPRQSPSSSQDSTSKTSPSEPIVLSSDDEESGDVPQHCSPAVHALVTVEDAVTHRQIQHEAPAKQQEASDLQDMQVLHVVVEDQPLIPAADYSCMGVAFSTLHCGGYQGKGNGCVMIVDQNIIIPLKDTSEQLEVMLTIDRKELRRYSVWEQQELEAQELYFKGDEETSPPAILLLCVSETAAAAVRRDLLKLCVKQDDAMNTGKGSPFILLSLRDPLEGMEGALLRSFLDIDCLNNLADEKSIVSHCTDRVIGLEDFPTPVLSLDDSLELIKNNGLDPHLLSLLGLESTEPRLDQDSPHSDADENTPPFIQLEIDSQRETALELLETASEPDTETQLKPEEDQKEQELKNPSERRKEEPSTAYTLCHHRTEGSYFVSLCKPDSSWTKYKHQGLTRRLIQFPPPPLKGGITVTMEDLQCLDSGQFLNDVIIDFYLKYLLLKVSAAAVAKRSHIFSSFFYKQLTRRDNASEGSTSDSCQRQRRHQRVKTWTRHVDIFKKDFLFVPVNQEAHWYLVVICFPGLEEPKSEAWKGPNSQAGKSGTDGLASQEVAQGSKSPTDDTETGPTLNNVHTKTEKPQEEAAKDPPAGPVNCTEGTCQKETVCKRPCILIMDSLKLSLHERVFKLIREYLQSEWEVRHGSSRDFSPDQMQSSHCEVPLQDNSSDCGLYLLQYVECFLKDPVVHFDLPLHLERWFPRQLVRRKRDEIRDLVLNLYRHQNLDSST